MVLSKGQARREVYRSKSYNSRGFRETREEARASFTSEFNSELVKEMLASANVLTRGNVTIRLAKSYGFCWGVERAIALAYEARLFYADKKIFITNEIIHNPMVNQRMRDMDIFFVEHTEDGKDFSPVREGDVVLYPAFGATLEEMEFLRDDVGAKIVDTTCPWVSRVWSALDKHERAKCTSVIHGKWKHEETVATSSFAKKYLIVLNMKEAEYVSDYILNGGNKAEFLDKFKNSISSNFDPDVDLESLGMANQTTMLKSETNAIAKFFEKTMMRKHGPANVGKHFVAFDTICDATQERQDAMFDLMAEKDSLDLMLVIGGFNSSNTSHLQEISELAGVPSYWVDSPDCVGPGNKILYRTVDNQEHVLEGWLPNRPLTIGVTSGASTPNKVVEDVLERVFMISKLQEAVEAAVAV